MIVLAFIGISAPLLLLDRGLYLGDEYYQILCSVDYLRQPVWPLTAAIGHGWAWLLGEHAFNYRILYYLFYTLTIIVGCWYYYHRRHNLFAAFLVFALVQVLWAGYKALIWGWYVPSDCFLALTCYAALEYIRHRSKTSLLLMAFLSTAAVMSRLPSIVILIVMTILILWRGNCDRSAWKHLCMYLTGVALTVVIILTLIYGNPLDYISAWHGDNVITGHSGNPLLMFLRPFAESLLHDTEVYAILFTGVGLLWIGKRIHKRRVPTLLWQAMAAVVLFLMLRVNLIYSYQNFGNIINYYYVTFFFIMGMILLVPYLRGEAPSRESLLMWLTVLGCSLCAAVGSDRSIRVAVCFPLLPALVLLVGRLKSPCASASLHVFSVAFIILIPFLKRYVTGYDTGLDTLTERITGIPSMEGLYSSHTKVSFIEKTTAAIRDTEKQYDSAPAVLLGFGRYPISYALGRVPADLQKYHQKFDSEEYAIESMALIDRDTDIVAFINFPDENTSEERTTTPIPLAAALTLNGFSLTRQVGDADIWVRVRE